MYNYNKVVLSIFQIVSKQGTGIQLTSLSISTFSHVIIHLLLITYWNHSQLKGKLLRVTQGTIK